MSRLADLRTFYELLASLGEPRRLRDCDARTGWPARGVYFFFEVGEARSASGAGPRVVRVGTHALTTTSRATLWQRLAQHRGVASTGGGSHRGSIFRLLVGEATARRDGVDLPTWGAGASAGGAARAQGLAPSVVREREGALEAEVSRVIGAMPFVCLDVGDAAGPDSLRATIERGSIALLSGARGDDGDPPSPGWLGQHSARRAVRASGLWNNRHVDESYAPGFLREWERAVVTVGRARADTPASAG